MTGPNAAATAASVSDAIDGIDGAGNALPYRKVAMFYDANLFGLPTDYAFPEAANTSASAMDQITSLAKLLTRKHTHADGNDYDLWDMAVTLTKAALKADPHLNDDEPHSVNYKPAVS